MSRELTKEKDKKAELLKASEAILDRATTEGRQLSVGEQTKLDANTEALTTCNSEIDRLVALDDYRRHGMPVRETGFENDYPGKIINSIFDPPGTNDAAKPQTKGGLIGANYRKLFGANLSNDGWASQQDFLAQIHGGMAHPGLNCMVEGTGSGGGFLVPTEYAAEMLDSAIEGSIVARRARIYPMGSDTKKIAGFDASTDTATTLYGGLQAQWLGESESATATNPRVRKIELKAKKLALFTSSSNEVAEDGMGLDAQLSDAMTVGTGWFLDYAFLRGTGVGQPLGVLNDLALVTVTAEAGQDPDTLVYENMIKMLSRIHAGCFNNSVWVCNPSCIPQLLSLYTPTGLGGAPVNVLRESNGGWSLLTRPVLMTEKLPAIGEKGDIILADFSQYAIGIRKELTIERSGHVYFMSDETAWRAISRVDGQGRWNKAFTPANGATQSWCVALAAR
jgi:HK97 family phage major capsid protein